MVEIPGYPRLVEIPEYNQMAKFSGYSRMVEISGYFQMVDISICANTLSIPVVGMGTCTSSISVFVVEMVIFLGMLLHGF